jgi:serine/threonine-protein kinase
MRPPEDVDPLEESASNAAQNLLANALSTASGRVGKLFGGYVLFEPLGRGGFGIVFRARRVGSDEVVALKKMRDGDHATPEERREFLAGAKTTAALVHPGIVGVRDVGESDECPFFTMDLVEGRNLAAAIESGQPSQAQGARWVQLIALAVHHAHSRGVLHRDLKPANILLDEANNPLVADFGSAKHLSEQGQCVESGAGVLSYYMAPEQASGDARARTGRTDIYSLGVILYELLTGQVPYEQLTFADWIQELVSPDSVRPPRALEPGINPDLERVCLRCLEKDPNRRYESAALLADDLDRVMNGWHPRHARPDGAIARSVRSTRHWARRHPVQSALVASAALLGLILLITVLSLQQGRRKQQQSALETNAFIASSQAGALLFQLREFAERAEQCAQKPGVRALLLADAVTADASELESCARGFRGAYVSDPDGRLLTQWAPPGKPVLGRNYAFRGYFQGARELARRGLSGAYLGPAYTAESTGQLQIAFASPVYGDKGAWLGTAIVALEADSAIGQVRMQGSIESGRIVALLGPRGSDSRRTRPNQPTLRSSCIPSWGVAARWRCTTRIARRWFAHSAWW